MDLTFQRINAAVILPELSFQELFFQELFFQDMRFGDGDGVIKIQTT